ncbi:Uncharacterised protein [Burkholderia oklahomensis]|nr:hypothetical protein BG90_4187 [Burkholderia oklahomensis C6786]SUY28056.1 Uncharacterised protein [Burkholderia oklahomensis]
MFEEVAEVRSFTKPVESPFTHIGVGGRRVGQSLPNTNA